MGWTGGFSDPFGGSNWPDQNIPGFLPAQYGNWGDYFGNPNSGIPSFGILPGEGSIPGVGTGTPTGSGFSWTSLLPLGIGLGGGLLGQLLGGPSGQQKAALGASTDLSKQMASNAAQGAGNAAVYSAMGLGPLAKALNYWSTLASGDRTAMSTALAPEINQIGQSAANAFDTTSQFAPRGGARTSALSQIPYQVAGQISNLYQTLRPAAIGQLQGLGISLADLGNTALGGSSSAAAGGAQGYLNLVSSLQGIKQNQQNLGQQIGAGLYNWAKGIDWGSVFGKG